MTTALQVAGATAEPSSFAPLHINRMLTGMWTNSNPLRDAASALYEEKFYGGRQDRLVDGVNCEISPRLTLHRRPGHIVYNQHTFPPIKRFYSWNTFTLTDENIRVLADTANTVYDVTHHEDGTDSNTAIWTKAAGASDTYFLGVGNSLFFTNGKENKQIDGDTGDVFDWGIAAPTVAPTLGQVLRPNTYGNWQASRIYPTGINIAPLQVVDTNSNVQNLTTFGTFGSTEPSWNPTPYYSTPDGTAMWENVGTRYWQANHAYTTGAIICMFSSDSAAIGNAYFYVALNSGTGGATAPAWPTIIGASTTDNEVIWRNIGIERQWADYAGGDANPRAATIVDAKGFIQAILQAGKTGNTPPTFSTIANGQTDENPGNQPGYAIWINQGPFAVAQTQPVTYVYEYMNSKTNDLSNASPVSLEIQAVQGNMVTVTGPGTGANGVDKVVIFRTLQGGSTYGYVGTVDNPGAGNYWTFNDTSADADVNLEWQAQIAGEGTPLPIGATCLEFHAGHIFAAVGNVVYVSAGPNATVGGSTGNAGFDTTFTTQSKITRFWVNSMGVAVLTVRDIYMIGGTGTSTDPFYIQRWISNLPLLNYDAFDVNLTTPHFLTGNRTVMSLDPAAGCVEMSFPIADIVASQFNPKTSYLTFHQAMTGETAFFLSDAVQNWYRLSPVAAPDNGFNWNPKATIAAGFSAVQSVEIYPGVKALLVGPPAAGGKIMQRDFSVNTDDGAAYPMSVTAGSIVLANPGQLAGLGWITTESKNAGKAPTVSLLLNETDGDYESLKRTHQDPPILPPSASIIANRHSALQGQNPVWCRHLKMKLDWPTEDAPNELYSFTVFGQIWQEMRAQ